MTHSLIGADRTTHFKIVAVALLSAIVLAFRVKTSAAGCGRSMLINPE